MIQKDEVYAAQKQWGELLVEIGSVKDSEEMRDKSVEKMLSLYDFESGEVLFKPTRAVLKPFRKDKKSARSYFVRGDRDFPEDTGFALEPWENVRFENAGIIIEDNRALAMGHYYLTNKAGKEAQVEYTFGYKKDDTGALKIDLHHSSMPFAG